MPAMSTNFKELSELIKISSASNVQEFTLEGEKISVKFHAAKNQNVNEPVPEHLQGPIEISPDLAKKIEEIHRQEEEINKMIEDPQAYEEELARLEDHELEDIPAEGEGDS